MIRDPKISFQVPHYPPDFYTCPFRTGKLDKWVSSWKVSTWLKSLIIRSPKMVRLKLASWKVKIFETRKTLVSNCYIPTLRSSDRCYCAQFPCKKIMPAKCQDGKLILELFLKSLIQVCWRRQPWHLFLPATTKQVLHFHQINAKTSKEKSSPKLLSTEEMFQ